MPVTEVLVSIGQQARTELYAARREAELKAQCRTHLNNSIEENEGTAAGCLGEIIVYDFLCGESWQGSERNFWGTSPAWDLPTGQDVYDYDLILRGPHRIKTEVKTKRQRVSGKPLPFYNATVCAKNTRQACDIYWFNRVYTPKTDYAGDRAWILGWLPKKEFFRLAGSVDKKGTLDPRSTTGYRFKEDCFNVPVEQLWPITTLEELQGCWADYVERMERSRRVHAFKTTFCPA